MRGDPNIVLVANPGADLYGSDRMAVESVRALVGAGRTVFVTVPGPGPLIDLFTAAGATVLEQPTPVLRKGLLSGSGLVLLAREALASLVPSYRLLRHTNAGTVLVNTVTVPLWFPVARLAGRRTVCHVHEAEGSASALIRRALYLPLLWCHSIIINSQFSLQVLSTSAPWLTARTTVIYNAVAGPSEVRAPRTALEGGVRLLYLGRLSHRKGPHVAIQAVRILKERGRAVHLRLLGAVFPGNESYEQGLVAAVQEAGIQDHVTFLGFRPDIWPELAWCDMVLIPSTVDEPFGNTAVEASLAARPLIVSDIAGLREASAAAASRVPIPASDAVAIADAVELIADEWDRYSLQAERDEGAVAERFSADRYAVELLDALRLPKSSAKSG